VDEFSVLLVDDEREFLETLIKRLKKRKLNVTGVNSGEDALKFLKETPTDVVVLDVRMEGMDGIRTAFIQGTKRSDLNSPTMSTVEMSMLRGPLTH